jgi:hypothetical protein
MIPNHNNRPLAVTKRSLHPLHAHLTLTLACDGFLHVPASQSVYGRCHELGPRGGSLLQVSRLLAALECIATIPMPDQALIPGAAIAMDIYWPRNRKGHCVVQAFRT